MKIFNVKGVKLKTCDQCYDDIEDTLKTTLCTKCNGVYFLTYTNELPPESIKNEINSDYFGFFQTKCQECCKGEVKEVKIIPKHPEIVSYFECLNCGITVDVVTWDQVRADYPD